MIWSGATSSSAAVFSLSFVLIEALIGFFTIIRRVRNIYTRMDDLERDAADYSRGIKLLIKRDLELNRANDKLQELDDAKSNFISVVAHQLRTPLSGIKWTLGMILAGDLGELNNEQKTFLMKSHESNNRMITLVNDMLSTDRLQSGRVHYGFTHINMVDLVDNVLFEVAPNANKRKITIQFKKKFKDIPPAYVDPETMRAVFQNLLENSIKYTIEGGKIDIDIKHEHDELEISIADNGIGIPVDQQKKIFGRFFRARNAVKQETDGSGLGLYIARTIIEKNGGRIWFKSAEGKGTTFYFTVPIRGDLLKASAGTVVAPSAGGVRENFESKPKETTPEPLEDPEEKK